MVQLAGKYELAENKNFYEFMVQVGVPEDKAKAANEDKEKVEVKVNGNNITFTNNGPQGVTNLILGGEEFVENTPNGTVLKSVATLNDGILTVTSKTIEGDRAVNRVYTFTDAGYQVTLDVPKDGKTISTTRIYKRV